MQWHWFVLGSLMTAKSQISCLCQAGWLTETHDRISIAPLLVGQVVIVIIMKPCRLYWFEEQTFLRSRCYHKKHKTLKKVFYTVPLFSFRCISDPCVAFMLCLQLNRYTHPRTSSKFYLRWYFPPSPLVAQLVLTLHHFDILSALLKRAAMEMKTTGKEAFPEEISISLVKYREWD